MQCSLVSFVSLLEIGFMSGFRLDVLDILYGGNLFSHTTLRNNFVVLDLDECYNNSSSAFVSYFDAYLESVKWHTGLAHIG